MIVSCRGLPIDFETWLQGVLGQPLGCLPLLLEKRWSTIPVGDQARLA